MSAPATAAVAYRIGAWRFDVRARSLQCGERIENLPLKVAAVLQCLAENPGQVVSRERMIASIWNGNDYTGPRGLTNAVWQLRRILDDPAGAASAIETIAKTGYRLSPAAQPLLPEAAAAAAAPGRAVAAAAPAARYRPAAAAVLLLAVAVLLAYTLLPETQPIALQAQPLTVYDGAEEFPDVSADGRRLAFTWERNDRPAQIYLRDLDGAQTEPQRVTLDEQAEELRPVWSPDGKALALLQLAADGSCRVLIRDLARRSDRLVAPCFYERLHQVMDWSPDGSTLAIARRGADDAAVSVYLHPLDGGPVRRLTHPTADAQDSQLAWSPDGRRLAFIRRQVNIGELHVVDLAGGREHRITALGAPMFGLAWLEDGRALAFNSMHDGSFGTWRVDAGGGQPRRYGNLDAPFNMSPLPGPRGGIAVSQHRSAEHIEVWDAQGRQLLASLSSAGRDLYAQWSPVSDRLMFLSTRSGGVELWTSASDGSDTRLVPGIAGLPGGVAWSPVDGRYAVTLRPAGAAHDLLHLGGSDREAPLPVLEDGHDYQNARWTDDGRALLVSSNRGGDWNLWRYEPGSGDLQQLTRDGGVYGQLTADGWLYYTRTGQPGLWRRRAHGGAAAEAVLNELGPDDWGNWEVSGGALYFLARSAEHNRVLRRPLEGGAARLVLELPRNAVRYYRSLAVTGDGRLVLTILGRRQADIVALRPQE